MKPLRVGVIGLGIGMRHARTVLEHPRAELAWLCDLDPAKKAEAARDFPDVPFTPDDREVLADPGLDAVCVASYDDAHFRQANEALARGRHVFIEKPLCLHEHEMRALAAHLEANPGLRLSTNLVLRTCRRFLALKREMDADALGELCHLEADYFWGRAHKLLDGWRAGMEFYSIIHGAAVHMVDLVMFLTGQRPLSVTAFGNPAGIGGSRQRHNSSALLVLRFEKGLTAKISAHGCSAHPHFHRVSVFGTRRSFLGEFQGAGWIDSSDHEHALRPENAPYPDRSGRGRVLASFLDAVVDPRAVPLVDEKDSFDAMSVCLAAERSVRSGCECVVQYTGQPT
jgi:predicted dehydrogenase